VVGGVVVVGGVFVGAVVVDPDGGGVVDPELESQGLVVALSDARRRSDPVVEAVSPAPPAPHPASAIIRDPNTRPSFRSSMI